MRYFMESHMISSMKLILPLLGLLLPLSSQAAAIKGKIYTDSNPSKVSYLWEKSEKKSGSNWIYTTRYTDLTGKILVEETNEYHLSKLLKYTYKQLQMDEGGTIEIKEGKVLYKYTAQGKEKNEASDLEENAIVPDMIEAHVHKNWNALMNGETIKIRLMILERQETIGFKFFIDQERVLNGKKVVDMTLKPSSIFIAMIAPNFHLTFEKETPHRLLALSGTMPVREPEVENPKTRKDYKAIQGRLEIITK